MNDSKPITKTDNSTTKSKVIKKVVDVVLALAIAGVAIYGIKTISNDFTDIEIKNESSEEEIISSSESDVPDTDSVIYVSEMMDNDEVYSGSLIVVNNETEYKGKDNNLVSMYDVLESDGTTDYMVMSADVKVKKDAAAALNDMVKAFAAETSHTDIIVDGGYRSVEYQQQLYDMAADKASAAKPGFSDYHTGYSVDFSISGGEDGTVKDFTGKDDYSWFEKNAYKYGFVLRFPEGKKDYTGYDYRPWHFRYVGKLHAYYMHENNMCLEEYVDSLKKYEYTQEHLTFTDENGSKYEIYYTAMDPAASTTILAVPNAEYEVSGNNTDGFIISFCTSAAETTETEAQQDTEEKPEESQTETQAE